MSELNLKSGTKKPARRMAMIRTLRDMQFFGVNASQLTPGMAGGLRLEWNGEVVIVTHDSYPGEERWVFPAGISDCKWVDE